MLIRLLQQYLPFTVLKHIVKPSYPSLFTVAPVLTVYGIEPFYSSNFFEAFSISVATVLTVYGIETELDRLIMDRSVFSVATVLTVYGIETKMNYYRQCVNM